MKKLLLLAFAMLSLTTHLAAQEPIHLGEFQTVHAGSVSYDAFVPKEFHPTVRWPFLLVVSDDPKAIARFQPGAGKYGYVLARASATDAKVVWDHARNRFNANASRSYLILSGRSSGRTNFGELTDVSGLAAVNTLPLNLDAPTVFFSFGNLDTSYIEMKQLSRMTSEQRRRVAGDIFDGIELTAEDASRIVEWFHLDALNQGTAVVTDDHVAGIVSSWTATAQALEAADPLRAVSMYGVIVVNFSAVTAQARSRSSQVRSSLAYSRAEYNERRAVRWEAAQKKKIVTSARTPGPTADVYLKRLELGAIRARAAGKDGAMKNAAIRLLRYAFEVAEQQARMSSGERQRFWQEVASRVRG